jgi:tight adherence protein B
MQSAITIAITAVAALAAGSVMVFMYWSVLSREDDRQAQLARRLGTSSQDAEDSLFLAQPDDSSLPGLGSIGDRLGVLLVEAGMPYDMNGLMVRCGVAALVGAIILGILTRGPLALLGLVFAVIPVVLLNGKATERARNLSEQLPDALDLVARSLQAGHGLADAMKLCAEEMPSPVSDEFGRVFEENSLGRDLRASFETLSMRNPRNFDLKLFVSSVLLQRDTGGNLIEILGNISKTIRDRFVFEAKVRALTAEARISALILGSLPFAILGLITFMRPNYLAPLWEDPLGNQLVAGALVWFGVGVMVMRNVSSVKV